MTWMNIGLTIYSAHDKSYLGGIGCASEVCVDLLGLGLVERYKPVEDVVASRSVVGAT